MGGGLSRQLADQLAGMPKGARQKDLIPEAVLGPGGFLVYADFGSL